MPSTASRATRPAQEVVRRRRRWTAAAAGAAAVLVVIASFTPWVSAGTETGGRASITGWGGIGGDSQLAGSNLNDVLAGAGSYRPGLPTLLFGVLAAVVAAVLAAGSRGEHPHRVTAAALTLCGLVALVWGVVRVVAPGDAVVFQAGETSASVGPWLTAVGGAGMLAAAVVVFLGRLDPPEAVPRLRGVQPARRR